MRSYGLTAAAALLALAAATPATALPASAPGALRGAIDDQATTQAVHCRARLGALAPLGLGHRLRLQPVLRTAVLRRAELLFRVAVLSVRPAAVVALP